MSTPPSPPASATLVVGSPPTKRQKVIDSSVSIDAAAATAPTATAAPADIIITTTTTTTVVENSSTIDERTETAVETVTLPVTTLSAEEEEEMEPIPPLQIKKLAPEAKLPTRGSEFAAGYDLYASRDTVVPARGKVLVDTDISMACPVGTYGRIAPRSGLAAKHHIDTGAGVIDADYRGPVKVLLFNHAETDFPVSAGDRVAQLVLERIVNPDVVEVQELQESVRGGGGFGSTGTN